MSAFYSGKRSKNLYDPKSKEPFKLSRSKIELFMQCPCCFYVDRRLGVGQPPGFPFNLNSAVDHLLKKEFDLHRVEKSKHPLMEHYKIDAVPFQHAKMDEWRDTFKGLQYHHMGTNLIVTGAVDDIWVNGAGELIIVDYKATSKDSEVSLDAEWQGGYKRQMEIYQWLARKLGFAVSNTGYFVYCNGKRDRQAFDSKLEFDVVLLPYTGDDSWIEGKLFEAYRALLSDRVPQPSANCDYCLYRRSAGEALRVQQGLAI